MTNPINPKFLPTDFVARLELIFPTKQLDSVLRTFAQSPKTVFRCNNIKNTTGQLHDLLAQSGIKCTPLNRVKGAFFVPENQRRALTESTACMEGRLYIQNPSSMLPPMILSPKPGEEVLDLAAAPGGKTIHMADLMQNNGRIGAVESVKKRFFRLKENIERAGADIVTTYLKDGRSVGRQCPERFDRVLLDAPCTGEGLFDLNNPKTTAFWSEKKIREMARKQLGLFHSAIQSLKIGGTLVYSTCTFAPEENEAIVDQILKKYGTAIEVVEVKIPGPDTEQGIRQWRNLQFNEQVSRACRIVPDSLFEGFFICKMVKTNVTHSV